MINTVLFDLDGTLVQHGHVLLPEMLAAWGYPRSLPVVKQVFNAQITWFSDHVAAAEQEGWMDDLWHGFYSRVLQALEIEDGDGHRAATIRNFFLGNPSAIPPLFSDVPPILAHLNEKGWQMGIITQRSAVSTGRCLAAYQLSDLFSVVIAGDDGYGRKPAPGPFQAALDHWPISPNQAIYVGDRIDDDCQGARNVGLAAFLVDRDNDCAWVDHEPGDYLVLGSLLELLNHLPDCPAHP